MSEIFANHWVLDYGQQSDDIRAVSKVFQNLDLSLDLLLLYWL